MFSVKRVCQSVLVVLGIGLWAATILIWAGHGEDFISEDIMNLALIRWFGFPFSGLPVVALIYFWRETYKNKTLYWLSLGLFLVPAVLLAALTVGFLAFTDLSGHG